MIMRKNMRCICRLHEMTIRVLRPALLTLLGLACAQGAVSAYVTDRIAYAPVNYDILLPPAVGGSYLDPAFGGSIKRMSDALVWPDNAGDGPLIRITHEYSTMSPFNSDNSRILVEHRNYFALYDGDGNYLRDLPIEISTPSEPRWSRQDPNILYYHAVYGNQLKQYNVETGASSVVHTFSEYTIITGFYESDISFDGDHVVLAGDGRYIFVYEISTDRKGPVLDTLGLGGFDNLYMTPDNHVLVGWYASGSGRYQGVELYDGNMNFVRQVGRALGHMDVTRDVDGSEVVIWANAGDPQPICDNGVVKIRLADGLQTCLLSLDWSLAFHVSAPDVNRWVIVSTYSGIDLDPLSGWKPYANEILQVRLDGSEVRRLAQHRSRPFNDYYATPRAAVSRDGGKLIYSSNNGLQAILGAHSQYSDVYLMDLATAAPAAAGSINPVAIRFEQNDPAVGTSCPASSTWYTATYAFLSGGGAAMAMNPGCRATFSFTGTAVDWIGYRDPWSGIADVYVDGEFKATVDAFDASGQPRAVLFSIGGLSAGDHTLTVEVTGGRNPSSEGSWIWIDAFDVVVRVEQDDTGVSYSCPPDSTWYTNMHTLLSGGSASVAMSPGCQATFSFTGTAVSWIGYGDPWSGIAQVYIDGAFRAEIDTYAPSGAAQARIYTLSGLAPGPHMLTIEVTGRLNPAAEGAWVWLDGFESRL